MRFHRSKIVSVTLMFFGLLSLSISGYAETLFQLNGKNFSSSDLPQASQQRLFDLDLEFYNQRKALIEELMLEQHFAEIAKTSKKDAATLKEEALNTGEPTEAELKAFYEQNKERIPPTMQFDQIKGQLQQIVKQQKMVDKRKELVDKILKGKSSSIALKAPQPPIADIAWQGFPEKGNSSSKVVVVKFADYRCPHCKMADDGIKNVWNKYKNKIRLVYLDYPIKGDLSVQLAKGGFCANNQKKFWEYHDAVFAKQADLNEKSAMEIAGSLKLNTADFEKCLSSKEAAAAVEKSTKEAERVGATGVPAIFINGKKLVVSSKFEDSFSAAIDAATLTN